MKNTDYLDKVSEEVNEFTKCHSCGENVSYEMISYNGKKGITECVRCKY